MTVWAAGDLAVSEGHLAHGIHAAIVAAGVVGLLGLLGPQWLARRAGSVVVAPRDEHEARVTALRASIAGGGLATLTRPAVPTPVVPDRVDSLLLPVVALASLGAAGIHAAMLPSHLPAGAATAAFFSLAALAQLGWAAALWHRVRREWLRAGVLLNLAVLGLWVVSRTTGIPGVQAGPEALGPWDLTCAAWEIVVVVGCVQLLRHRDQEGARMAPMSHWQPVATAFAVATAAALAALAVSGFGG